MKKRKVKVKETEFEFSVAYDQGGTFRELRIFSGDFKMLLHLSKKDIQDMVEGLQEMLKY